MVTQKLPQEYKSKQSEVQILEETISNPNISREYLKDLQEQVTLFYMRTCGMILMVYSRWTKLAWTFSGLLSRS